MIIMMMLPDDTNSGDDDDARCASLARVQSSANKEDYTYHALGRVNCNFVFFYILNLTLILTLKV
jgi:hypothetical protein